MVIRYRTNLIIQMGPQATTPGMPEPSPPLSNSKGLAVQTLSRDLCTIAGQTGDRNLASHPALNGIVTLLRQGELANLIEAWDIDAGSTYAWRHIDINGAWVDVGGGPYSDYTFILGLRDEAGHFEAKVDPIPSTGTPALWVKYYLCFRHD